jgi:hypothetical protein
MMVFRVKIIQGKLINIHYSFRHTSDSIYNDTQSSKNQIKPMKNIKRKSKYLTSDSKETWKSTLRTVSQNEQNQRKFTNNYHIKKIKLSPDGINKILGLLYARY